MKEGIHPNYRPVVFKDSVTDDVFILGSTMETDKTIEIDGVTYPLFVVDTSSASHPFYTGKMKFVAAEGRVSRFNKKYGLE
ncbi:MAG: type B 50S ribosomal protein L31 [Erysipelothrix sp.]|nr:type B 50S ribosomal protein L31 [Erysipelothrix sp.]